MRTLARKYRGLLVLRRIALGRQEYGDHALEVATAIADGYVRADHDARKLHITPEGVEHLVACFGPKWRTPEGLQELGRGR